jgi:hypothetical protein
MGGILMARYEVGRRREEWVMFEVEAPSPAAAQLLADAAADRLGLGDRSYLNEAGVEVIDHENGKWEHYNFRGLENDNG